MHRRFTHRLPVGALVKLLQDNIEERVARYYGDALERCLILGIERSPAGDSWARLTLRIESESRWRCATVVIEIHPDCLDVEIKLDLQSVLEHPGLEEEVERIIQEEIKAFGLEASIKIAA